MVLKGSPRLESRTLRKHLVEHPRQPRTGLIQPLPRDRQRLLLVGIRQLGPWFHPLARGRVLVSLSSRQQGFPRLCPAS